MISIINTYIIPAALSLLPKEMDNPRARAMLLSIGLQESRFTYRRQLGAVPYAKGLWQFEVTGIRGVRVHDQTRDLFNQILNTLCYDSGIQVDQIHTAIEHNDILACCIARLLLWTLPQSLPGRDNPQEGYKQYINAWRPGRPHPKTWNQFYSVAWDTVVPVDKDTRLA